MPSAVPATVLLHLLEVAQLVAASLSEPDNNLIIAALLHDTIEDTATTQEELARRFGSDVADLVAEVTDDKTLPKQERKRLQIETASKKPHHVSDTDLVPCAPIWLAMGSVYCYALNALTCVVLASGVIAFTA
jgi:(p)ppGpp synthase/HD superfamily hydrolase